MQTANPQATVPTAKRAFSAEEVARIKAEFAEQGYAVFPNVVSKERLAQLNKRLHEEFEKHKASGKLFEGGGLMTGHLNCFPGEESRWVYQTLIEQGIV